jgi:hypothetical protein
VDEVFGLTGVERDVADPTLRYVPLTGGGVKVARDHPVADVLVLASGCAGGRSRSSRSTKHI